MGPPSRAVRHVTSAVGARHHTQVLSFDRWLRDGECCCVVVFRCDAHYSGDSCEVADAQWQEFDGRVLTNANLVWYKTTTVAECKKRCTMDWSSTATPYVVASVSVSIHACTLCCARNTRYCDAPRAGVRVCVRACVRAQGRKEVG